MDVTVKGEDASTGPVPLIPKVKVNKPAHDDEEAAPTKKIEKAPHFTKPCAPKHSDKID